MLQKFVNGSLVKFEGSINMQLFNPLFNEYQSYSYPFKTPLEPNKNIYSFPQRPDIHPLSNKIPCLLKFNSFSLNGYEVIESIDENLINSYFKGNGDFWTYARETKLSELNLPITSTPSELGEFIPFAENMTNETDVNDQIAVFTPLVNTKFTSKYPLVVNIDKFVNLHVDGELSFLPTVYVPFFYVHYIVREIFKNLGIDCNVNILEKDPDFKKLILYNNYCLNQYSILKTSTVFAIVNISKGQNPTITTQAKHGFNENDIIYIDGPIWSICQVNLINIESGSLEDGTEYRVIGSITYNGSTISDTYFTAVTDVAEYTGTGSVVESKQFKAKLATSDEEAANIGSARLCALDTSIIDMDTRNHLPDMSLSDFLLKLEKNLGIIFDLSFDGTKVSIHKIKDILNNPAYIDITKYSSKQQTVSPEIKNGYQITFKADSTDGFYKSIIHKIPDNYNYIGAFENIPLTANPYDYALDIDTNNYKAYLPTWLTTNGVGDFIGWTFLSYKYDNVYVGDKEFSLELDMGVLKYYDETLGYVPRLDNEGNSISFEEYGRNSFQFRLMFYHGRINNFPFTSYDVLDQNNVKISGANLSLDADSEYSIFKQLYYEWIHLNTISRKDVKLKIVWPMDLLTNFDFTKKYRIGTKNYLVKKINLSIQNNVIVFGDTELCAV